MLNKFLNVYKLSPFSSRDQQRKPVAQPQQELGEGDQKTSVLKIVHAGGIVDCYYMAIPAAHIMKKCPPFILARPHVFRQPWDSLVRSDEILTPGEKLYLVPRQTVRKLRQRIRKPNGEVSLSSFVSQSSIDVSKDGSDSSEVSRKRNASKKHARLAAIDAKQKAGVPAIEKSKDEEAIAESSKKKTNLESQGEKRTSRNGVSWQPSLKAISEHDGPGE